MADFQLPTLERGAAGIDQALQLLHVVTKSLERATEQAARQNDTQGEEHANAHQGAHRERRG